MLFINGIREENYSVVGNRVAVRAHPHAAITTLVLDGVSRKVVSMTKSSYVQGVMILTLA